MKKFIYYSLSITICICIFFIMPYMMLKSSIQPNCTSTSTQCAKTTTNQIQQLVSSFR